MAAEITTIGICPECNGFSNSIYELAPDKDGSRRFGAICNDCKQKWQGTAVDFSVLTRTTPILTRLAEFKALADAATPGDWYFDERGANWLMSPFKTVLSASHDGNYVSNVDIQKANAEFIATSRTAMPQLIEALRVAHLALNVYSDGLLHHKLGCCTAECVCGKPAREALTRIAELLEVKE